MYQTMTKQTLGQTAYDCYSVILPLGVHACWFLAVVFFFNAS
jgi:hypothetical protein